MVTATMGLQLAIDGSERSVPVEALAQLPAVRPGEGSATAGSDLESQRISTRRPALWSIRGDSSHISDRVSAVRVPGPADRSPRIVRPTA
ncbi:hypothetical protein [Haloplanus natans]|uniref:hypothetical protein n=1 Tax=Haloplanus natans TaxID=376171 RepID=UPI000677D906|nr:hypothetical protein [Haloplanus natans]